MWEGEGGGGKCGIHTSVTVFTTACYHAGVSSSRKAFFPHRYMYLYCSFFVQRIYKYTTTSLETSTNCTSLKPKMPCTDTKTLQYSSINNYPCADNISFTCSTYFVWVTKIPKISYIFLRNTLFVKSYVS